MRTRTAAPVSPLCPSHRPTPTLTLGATARARRTRRLAPEAEISPSGHIKFKPSEMTPVEMRQLRARLTGELGRVCALLSRINSWQDRQRRRRDPLAMEADPEQPQLHASRVFPPPPPALVEAMQKRCAEILMRLRKSKKSVRFNSPVDVEGLKLPNYHAIIQSPVDLGSVKQNLAAGRYLSHEAFAGDVQLSFGNALHYNPLDHHVHSTLYVKLSKLDKF